MCLLRVTEVRLTAGGRTALEQAAPARVDLVKHLFFAGMPRDLLDPISTALEAVHANLLTYGSLPLPNGD